MNIYINDKETSMLSNIPIKTSCCFIKQYKTEENKNNIIKNNNLKL